MANHRAASARHNGPNRAIRTARRRKIAPLAALSWSSKLMRYPFPEAKPLIVCRSRSERSTTDLAAVKSEHHSRLKVVRTFGSPVSFYPVAVTGTV